MLLIKRKMTLIHTFQNLDRHPNFFSVVEYPAAGLIQGRVSFINRKLYCGFYSRAGLVQERVTGLFQGFTVQMMTNLTYITLCRQRKQLKKRQLLSKKVVLARERNHLVKAQIPP